LLDIVVRDKKGKPVRNLKAGDMEIYEDGVKQDIRSFRFVGGREAVQGATSSAKSQNAAGPPAVRALRSVNPVCIVFHNLDPVSRLRANQAVLDFLKNEMQPNTYVGIFVLDDRLTPVYPFTNDRNEIAKAAQNSFSASPVDFTRASQAVLTANPNQATLVLAVNNAIRASSATVTQRVTGGEVATTSVAGADVATGRGANALRGDRVLERSDFGGLSGMREEDKIKTLIDEFGTLPGRKTVLLATTGLLTTGDPDRFQKLVDKATRAGITIYALDVTGTNENSSAQAGNLELGQVANVSRTQTQAAQGPGSLTAMKQKSRQGDNTELAVRASDRQASLRALSESTGGFLIANTNEFRKPFQRIMEDVDSHYEAAYRPVSDDYDGRLRKIEVKVARSDLRAESRTGYFALREGSLSLAPHETTALAILSTLPLPQSFPFRTAGFHFRSEAADSQGTLVFEVPGSSLAATAHPASGTHALHASVVALVKDAAGQVKDTFSIDAPYEVPDANLATLQQGAAMYTHPVALPPGQYTVQTAVLDREGSRASTSTMPFDLPQPTNGVGISSVVLVQRVEPVTGQANASDPLIFNGKRLVPFIGETLSADAKPFVYFVIYPDKKLADKPKVRVEFLVDGKVLASQTADLPAPDPSGTIPMIVKASTHEGHCELKITALQGSESATGNLKYAVASK